MQYKNKGIALLTVVIFVFTLAVMGFAFLSLINIDVVEFNHQYQDVQAKYISESGISKAIWYLNKKITIPQEEEVKITSLDDKSYKIGNYSVKIITQGKTKIISSVGKVKKGEVEILIEAQDDPTTEEVEYHFKPGTWKRKK